ncbi:MAG: transposase [Planctomycetes bacterium]|nr:transposase [Planctomycetota bacterium]
MVLGYHSIISAFGFWLPNDPRGSWSDFVGAWDLFRYGPATKTTTRSSVAGVAHNKELRLEAKSALKYPAVVFDGRQARAVAQGFSAAVEKSGFTIWACAILPEHIHLILARHSYKIEQIINLLKGEATKQLVTEGIHPLSQFQRIGKTPTCWAKNGWNVFLNTAADIERSIEYVNKNPEKEGKPRQHWKYEKRYEALNV